MPFKINLCKIRIHYWDYSEDETIRTCSKCGKRQKLVSSLEAQAFYSADEWEDVP